MQHLVALLEDSSELTHAQVEEAVAALTSDGIPDDSKASFLSALRTKGETAAEIAAFAQALLARAIDPGIDPAQQSGPVLDVCGTGGDKMDLFNVSTTSMFVLAAGGAVVVKHGNRAITSQCGGADVLEALGIRIDLPPEALRESVKRNGLGFVFAPAYHPAFKAIVPVRKLLASKGIPTIFNLLGPLLNPARPDYQLVGIFSRELLPKYAATLAALGRRSAWVVHCEGIDEIATTGPSEVHSVSGDGVSERIFSPEELGFSRATLEDLRGGGREENAAILLGILDGSIRGPKRDVVELNAAAGFVVSGLAPDLPAGIALAREQIESGRALAKLHALQQFRPAGA